MNLGTIKKNLLFFLFFFFILEEYSTRLNRIQLTRCSVVQHSSSVLSEMAEEVEFLCSWLKSGSVSWESNCLVYISTIRTETQKDKHNTKKKKIKNSKNPRRKPKSSPRVDKTLKTSVWRGRHRPSASFFGARSRIIVVFYLNYNPSDRRQCVLKC